MFHLQPIQIQLAVFIKKKYMEEITNINDLIFPEAKEGDKVLHYEVWYVYTNGTWVEETN
jgi:hypothetical protein